MRARNRRLGIIGVAAIGLAASVGLAAIALRDTAAFFQTPSEFLAAPPEPGQAVKVGGLVEIGTLIAVGDALTFRLVDDVEGIGVRYAGVVPNLFREGQCVIAEGERGPDGVLNARRLQAKHDEEYLPPELDAAPRLARSCGPDEVAS